MATKKTAPKKHKISKGDFNYHVSMYNDKEDTQRVLCALIRFTKSLNVLMETLIPMVEKSHRKVMGQRKHHLEKIRQYNLGNVKPIPVKK